MLFRSVQYAGNCVVNWSGGASYSVTTSDGGHELVVNLEKKTCTCRKWDLTGIPCYHACACIAMRNEPWDHHISGWYKKDMYLKVYLTITTFISLFMFNFYANYLHYLFM